MKSTTPADDACCAHTHGLPSTAPTMRLAVLLQFAFIAILAILIVFYRHTPAFATFSITFVAIFLEALPFMLLGAAIGGLIEVFVSKAVILRILPSGRLSAILLAAGLGMVFPVCECAIVPVVRRLFAKGLPLGAGIAFLLGGPIVNPLVFFSTAVAYGNDFRLAGARLLIGYLIAVMVGFFIDWMFTRQSALVSIASVLPGDTHANCVATGSAGLWTKTAWAMRHAAADFVDISRFLVFGAVAAGLLQTLVVRGELAELIGSPVASILLMMSLAVLLSLCSEADAFVAASFRTMLPFAAQMAFMVLGPMLDLKLIAMYFRMFRKRLILVLSTTTAVVVFLTMLLMQGVGP
ncbi:permease [Desulfosarcina variabilis]|uniref:permease n=1 Tax=Desulfosarcina variabilis TaxID=2300 RepID=UPI003AFA1C3C